MPSTSDLVDVNPLCDLVTFDDIPENYTPGQDIFVIYQLGESFKATTKDWVGLYRLGWSDIRQYLTFQWSPKKPRNPKFPKIRSALFLGKNLQDVVSRDANDLFQFLYVAKGQHIVGVSRRFTISSNPQPQLLRCVDRCVDNFGSLTFIEVAKSGSKEKAPRLVDGYDMVGTDEETQPLLEEEQSEEERRVMPWKKWEVVPTHGTSEDWLMPVSSRKLKDADIVLTIPDGVYARMKQVLEQLQTKFTPVDRPLGLPARAKCQRCQKRRAEMKDLKEQHDLLGNECTKIRDELDQNVELMEMKEWLVAALSEQVKNLVSENTTLHVMKEKLEQASKQAKMCKRCSKMWAKLTFLQGENQRLKEELLEATKEVQALQQERNLLEVSSKESEEKLRAKCHELEKDLVRLTANLPGNCATWEVVPVSRRSKSSEKATAALHEKIYELESNVKAMNDEVQETRAELEGKGSEYDKMIRERDELLRENEELTQRVDQLEHGLSVEQKKRCEQARKHKDMETDLNDRVLSLSAALEDAHLTRRLSRTEAGLSNSLDASTSTQQPEPVQRKEFSFSEFFSMGIDSLSKQIEETARPLIEPVEETLPMMEFMPTPMFDFYPTTFPEPAVEDTWAAGLLNSFSPAKNDIELEDISLGKACNKRKVVFDFRNDDMTKEVVDARDEVKYQPKPKVVDEPLDLRPFWKTATRKEPKMIDEPLDLRSFWRNATKTDETEDEKRSAKKTCQEKLRRPATKSRKSKPKRLLKPKETSKNLAQACASTDTNIVCPYCDFVFEEATSLSTISRHIEQHTK